MQPGQLLQQWLQSAQQEVAAQVLAVLLLAQVCMQQGWGQTLAGCGQQHRQH
jgi:hypothetical protein